MPITQSRMLDLLEEYEDFIGVTKHVLALISMATAAHDGELAQAINMQLSGIKEFKHPHATYERKHYDSHARRNNRVREAAERARRAKGIPERTSKEHRMQQTRWQHMSQAEKEYAIAMQGRPITDADIAPHRGEELRSHAEAKRIGRAEDKAEVKSMEQLEEQAIANADRGVVGGDEI